MSRAERQFASPTISPLLSMAVLASARRGPVAHIVWRPEPDISTYELAHALPFIIAAESESAFAVLKTLPPEVRRHFQVVEHP